MTNYDNSVIYKICCKDEAIIDVYVGSTVNARNRKHTHKSACNNKDNNTIVYRYIRDHGGWENWQFVLLEKFPCKDKQELVIRERYWFELLRAKLNTIYPQRGSQEYNKEYNSRPEVKERVKTRMKEYHEGRKDDIKVQERIKENNRKYRNRPENKDNHKEYNKKYYSIPENRERQKQQISERNKQTYTCLPCNKVLRLGGKSRHEKSNKHLQNLEKQEIEDSENE